MNKISHNIELVIGRISSLLNLHADTDEAGTVTTIRENTNFHSANAWTLVFAIFVASIGLNTNSAAVIIGAMLISPLMGPILGTGLALGINDFELLKRSAQNLVAAVGISLATSTIYFLISPISEVQSELLARTQPSFYDVMIALFGGAAGIVAISRKEKGNAIPGVAIATALMPPLCTAGYGLANGKIGYFAGAFYLFIINCVFISLSTYAFVRYMRFSKISFTDEVKKKKINRMIAITTTIVVLPSIVLAYFLQRETSFRSRAQSFIKNEIKFERSFLVDKDIDYKWGSETISLSFIGESITDTQIAILKERMHKYSLSANSLFVRQASLEENFEKRMSQKQSSENSLAREYEIKINNKDQQIRNFTDMMDLSQKVTLESKTIFPNIDSILVYDTQTDETNKNLADTEPPKAGKKIQVIWKNAPNKTELNKLSAFLESRTQVSLDQIIQTRKIR